VIAYVGAIQTARLLGTPAELLVPVVWWLGGRRGAPLAPTAVVTANAVLATGVAHLLRRHPETRIRRLVSLPLLAWTILGPAVAGRSRRWVLTGRNPLWALPLQLAAGLAIGLAEGVAVIVVGRRAAAAAASDREG